MNKTVSGLLSIPNMSKPSTHDAQIHTHSLVEALGESLKEAFKESGKQGHQAYFDLNPKLSSSKPEALNLKP